jgi:hypothetical protein
VREHGTLENDKNVVSFAQLLAMARYQKSEGYDPVMYWTRLDLRRIYKTEGFSTRKAIKMAGLLYEGIRQLNRKEIYSWSKARELEEPSGNASDLEEIAANYRYAYLDYGDEVWEEIESFAMPDKREVAHYERLRGQRMRLSPEVKEARKKARSEERQREQKAQREKELAEWRESFEPLIQQVLTRVRERQQQQEDNKEGLFGLLLKRIRRLKQQAEEGSDKESIFQ